ncbi:MAG: hypothetical protein ACRDJG_12400 [Actinomycetota bacterium]
MAGNNPEEKTLRLLNGLSGKDRPKPRIKAEEKGARTNRASGPITDDPR